MAKIAETSNARMTLRRLLRRPKYRYMVVNRIVPHLPWMVLFAMASLFYKARIFGESGYYLSQVINNQIFWIECQRIVLGISQILPLIGVWLGLEIKYLLLAYSLSHIVFFYLLFLFVYYILRDRRSGLLILLSQTLGIVYSFYNPAFELYYGISLLITFYAIWRLPFRYNSLYILITLEVLILLSHPAAILLFAFLLLYDFRKASARPFLFYLPVVMILLGAIAFRYFVPCSYDSAQLVWHFNIADSSHYLPLGETSYYRSVGIFLLRYYSEILVALIIVLVMLVNRKQWFRLLLVAATVMGYMLIVNSSDILIPSMHLEQLMFPLVIIVFIPLIYGFSSKGRQGRHNLAVFVISGLVVYHLALIYEVSGIFMKRVSQMEQLIETAGQKSGSKFVVSNDLIDHNYTQANWSYPIETMLLSAFKGDDLTISIVTDHEFLVNNNGQNCKANQVIYANKDAKDYTMTNGRYFHFDMGPYRTLNDSTFNENINYTANDLRITINSKKIYPATDTVWIPVTIVNLGKTPVYSGKRNKMFLSYFWISDNDVMNWDEIRTPLQADIMGTLRQDIKVAVPIKKGRMQLKVDIIANDNWLGISSLEDVLVY